MINNYHYKPTPVFCLGNGESFPMELRTSDKFSALIGKDEKRNFNSYRVPFYGIEIEIEDITDEKISASVWSAIQKINALNFYIKHDSSLQNGLELVSHPRSFNNWVESHWKLRDLFSTLRKYKLLGSSTRCGLHVHMGWSSFSSATHIMRFTRLMQELQFPLIMHQKRKSLRSFLEYANPTYDGDRSTHYLLRKLTILAGSLSYSSVCNDMLRPGQYNRRASNLGDHHGFLSFTERTLEVRGFPGASSNWQLYKALYIIEAVREYTFNHGLKSCTLKDLELWLLNHYNKYYRLFGRKLRAFSKRLDLPILIETYAAYTGHEIIPSPQHGIRSASSFNKKGTSPILLNRDTNDNRYSTYTNTKIRRALEKLESLGFFPGFVGARKAETEKLYSDYLPSEATLISEINLKADEILRDATSLRSVLNCFKKFGLFGILTDEELGKFNIIGAAAGEQIIKDIYSDTTKMYQTLSPYEKTLATLCYYSDNIFTTMSKSMVDDRLQQLRTFFEKELEQLVQDQPAPNKYLKREKNKSIYSDNKGELIRLYSTIVSKITDNDSSFCYYWGSLGIYSTRLKKKLMKLKALAPAESLQGTDYNNTIIDLLRGMKASKIPAFIRNGCTLNEDFSPKKPNYNLTGTSTFVADVLSSKEGTPLNNIAIVNIAGECYDFNSLNANDDGTRYQPRLQMGVPINPEFTIQNVYDDMGDDEEYDEDNE